MKNLKRKRVDAPRIRTLEDVHPYTTWSMYVRVYHKFYVERFAVGRKRLSMVLMDEKGNKMVAIIYDDEVDQFDTSLVEGRDYYVRRMSAEPVMNNLYYKFAESHFVCHFTSQTIVREITTVGDELIPLFPMFTPLDRVWQFTLDTDMYVDVVGMVLYVSSVGIYNSLNDRRIPFIYIYMYIYIYLIAWEKSASQHSIVVATMLWANPLDHCLETTPFSRVYFDPNIAPACEISQRINNDLNGPSSP